MVKIKEKGMMAEYEKERESKENYIKEIFKY